MDYDLAVIGAGPAGSSAALTAARLGLRVVLCERSADPDGHPRNKVCGEFISAEAAPLLAEWIPETWARARVVDTLMINMAGGQSARFRLPNAGWGLSRPALDAALWRAAGRAGACLRPHTAIAGLRPGGGGIAVRVAGGGSFTAAQAIV
ncbi:MAG: NAD(P)/FAD-dependent oxidoreductase, partial [Terriglobales bacterium]